MHSIRFIIICFLLFSCKKGDVHKSDEVLKIDDVKFSFVLHDGLSQSIIDPIKSKLEANYLRVLSDLMIDTMNKVQVSIWGNQSNFYDDMRSKTGTIYYGATGWIPSKQDIRILYVGANTAQVVLHEFCHAVSLVVNGSIGNNPRWLWESVAIYEAGEFVDPKTISYLVNRDFPTVSDLNTNFNSGGNKIYAVGYILSEFIISKWGADKYIDLIISNGNIQNTLGLTNQQFEEGWANFVVEKYLK